MGSNTITAISDGTTGVVSQVNQYRTALIGDHVPRNASAIATDIAASLGSSTYEWLKAFIASGYWTCGDIKFHHTYNGAAPIDNGWFPCDGTVINETNYNAIHGAGAWATYVGSSPLDGKYSPNMVGKYPVGASSTTQDGTSAITSVGNTSSQLDLQHSHTHNHQWYDYINNNALYDQFYDSGGNATSTISWGSGESKNAGINILAFTDASGSGSNGITDSYTDNDSTTALSATTDIRPESIEGIFYIRII